ncbi:MAG: hypothetical protein U0996_00320 [Planctomycetaceae bacterium]
MHVALLLNRVSTSDSADVLDVLRQCSAVEDSLRSLGHTTERITCSLNLYEARRHLLRSGANAVFNLVESLGGTDRLMALATVLLESLDVPFTGASSLAMQLTTQKVAAKRRLSQLQLPTPAWISAESPTWQGLRNSSWRPDRAIIKAVAEHASLGMTDDSVISMLDHPEADVVDLISARTQHFGTPHFVEEYIDGREFNLSVLASDDGPEVLPPAEIEFVNYPNSKPRIVGAAAKWNENAPEYRNTPRRFDFPHADQPLLDELKALARRCWEEFGLRGYARVDFRVDCDGQPWILELNANPCLSPDAGFAAAVAEAGLSFDSVVERILTDAFR